MKKLFVGFVFLAVVCGVAGAAGLQIDCDYPGGNVKVVGIDEKNGVVNIAPDLRCIAPRMLRRIIKLLGNSI